MSYENKKTVVAELFDPIFWKPVDFTSDVNLEALDRSESICLGRYCKIPVANGENMARMMWK